MLTFVAIELLQHPLWKHVKLWLMWVIYADMQISGLEVSHETQIAQEKTSQNPPIQIKYHITFFSWLTTSTDSDTHSPSPSLWGKATFLIRLLEWKQSSCQPALSVPSHPVTAVSVLHICAGCRWKGLPGHRHTPESCSESSQTSRHTHNHTRDWSTDWRHIWPSDIKMWEQTSFVISQNSIFLCFLSVFCRGERKQDWRTEAIFLWCSRFEFLTWLNLVRTQMIWFKGSVTCPCPSHS